MAPLFLDDPELAGLLLDRERLLHQIAPVLRRVGHTHPDRSGENKRRARKRKDAVRALRTNAELIAARCMTLHKQNPYRAPLVTKPSKETVAHAKRARSPRPVA